MSAMSDKMVRMAVRPPCDVCKVEPAQYDAKTTSGPWAYLCRKCYGKHGIRLGLGWGQRILVFNEEEQDED